MTLFDGGCCTVAYSMRAGAGAVRKSVLSLVAAWVFAACGSSATSRPEGTPPAVPPSATPITASSPSPAASGLVLTPAPVAASGVIPPLDDPGEVARELIGAELAIRSHSTPEEAFARIGRLQQAAYRKLVANPGFRNAALQPAPEELRGILESNIRAGELLSSLTRPVTRLPAWRIVPPPPPAELRGHYDEAEKQFGVPWEYLAAIHLVESRMGRIRGTSTAGAQGPMQFIPSTWARYGKGDINDPRDAILAAGRYLKAAGAPSAMARALYAYNHSQKYVDAVTLYAGRMRDEKRAYLAYYHWQVYVRTTSGDVLLEVGYGP